MAERTIYAARTEISVSKSKADIEKLVTRYGADGIGTMTLGGTAQVAFRMKGRNILFRMGIPDNPQKERSIWRALLLTIKGKLESSECGIESFEDAFLANIVMPNGQTVSEMTRPVIASHYSGNTNIPLLPPR